MTRLHLPRRCAPLARASLAGVVGLAGLSLHAPAGAGCPGTAGTLPGFGPRVIAIGQGDAEPYRTIYIDDRGLEDDTTEDNGGVWIYAESNGWAGLQRGGVSAWYVPDAPYIAPIVVLPPDPDRPVAPRGVTLFRNGFGGHGLREQVEWSDDCVEYGGEGQPAESDTLLF